MYMLALGHIICHFRLLPNTHADETQLYVSFKSNDPQNLDTLHCCLTSIKDWMSQIFWFFLFREYKTICEKSWCCVWWWKSYFWPCITIGSDLFLQIRNIAKSSSALPKNIVEQIIQAFISSCFDYCTSLFLLKTHLYRLEFFFF